MPATPSARLGVYCPDLPPVPGGLPDHTLSLARALQERGADVVVLGRRGDPAAFAPVPCLVGVTHRPGPRGLPAACRELGVSALLVQYVPFLYARRGVVPLLVTSARLVRRRGVKLGVLVHEPWVPPTRAVWRVTGPLQRRQLLALVRLADAVYCPVPAFLDLVRPAARAGARTALVPVGSGVPVVPCARAGARSALGLGPDDVAVGAFSPAASGARPEWLTHAAAALRGERRVVWVIFGNGSEAIPAEWPEGARLMRLGRLGLQDLSRTLRAVDVAVAPFRDGLTMRRSSAMAALAHGVPLVSSDGPLADPALADAATLAADLEGFVSAVRELVADAAARRALASRGLAAYESRLSTEVLAARLAADLGGDA